MTQSERTKLSIGDVLIEVLEALLDINRKLEKLENKMSVISDAVAKIVTDVADNKIKTQAILDMVAKLPANGQVDPQVISDLQNAAAELEGSTAQLQASVDSHPLA